MAEAFNTLDASKRLADAGCDPSIADAVVREINGAIAGNVATKDDIERLEERLASKIDKNHGILVGKIEGLEAKIEGHDRKIGGLESKIGGLESKTGGLESKTGELESKIDAQRNYLLYRMALMNVAVVGLLFALIKFFG